MSASFGRREVPLCLFPCFGKATAPATTAGNRLPEELGGHDWDAGAIVVYQSENRKATYFFESEL